MRLGLTTLEQGNWLYTFSSVEFNSSIFRGFIELDSGGVEMLYPDRYSVRSQDLPVVLYDAGQFYWGRAQTWKNMIPFFGGRSKPIMLESWRVIDINTQEDWARAEFIAKLSLNDGGNYV